MRTKEISTSTVSAKRPTTTIQRAPTGLSLHIGLNAVSAAHYGSTHPLGGCHNDARDLEATARASGYQTTILLDAEATASRILEHLGDAAERLVAGDTMLITYAGHGAQALDAGADELDGLDETWVVYDRMLLDDEIFTALARFQAGVQVLFVSDSCHSGTITRVRQYHDLVQTRVLAADYVDTAPRFRTPTPDFGAQVWSRNASVYDRIASELPSNPRSLVRAGVIQLSACQDGQLAADGPRNGLFTSKLLEVWAAGAFAGNHRAFGRAIHGLMPPTQTPNYSTFGERVEDFEGQTPFTGWHKNPETTTIYSGEGTKKMNVPMNVLMSDDGNWAEVASELEKKFPGWRPPTSVGRASEETALAPTTRAATGAPIVRVFWWGFHIECSSQGLRDFLNAAEPINAIAAAIGPVTGPAAPFVLAAAATIAGMLQLLRGLDQGNGVYISMTWFVPGVFIPTTVPVRGITDSGGRTRQLGQRVDLHGDHIQAMFGNPNITMEMVFENEVQVLEGAFDIDTGAEVRRLDRVVLSAYGSIWAGVWFTGQNGPRGWNNIDLDPKFPLVGSHPFCLIGRLNGRYFYVGDGKDFFHRQNASRLQLRTNDDMPGNGSGAFTCLVQVWRRI